MTDTEKNAIRAMACAIVDADAGKSSLPPLVIAAMRGVVAQAVPHCTPEQIANKECPTA